MKLSHIATALLSITPVISLPASGTEGTKGLFSNEIIPPPPALLTPEDYLNHATLGDKLLEFNKWIMFPYWTDYKDNKETWVPEGRFFKKEALTQSTKSRKGRNEMFNELARTTIELTKAQMFENGNHRTATLLVLDYLASHNIEYKKDPVQLYLDLRPSTYDYTNITRFTTEVAKILKKSVGKPGRPVPEELRTHYAERVKYAELLHHKGSDAINKIKQAQTQVEAAKVALGVAIAAARESQRKLQEAYEWQREQMDLYSPNKKWGLPKNKKTKAKQEDEETET